MLGNKTHVPTIWDSGLNGGVLFMRLDRMREFDFENKIIKLFEAHSDNLLFLEQDLLNILFSQNLSTKIVYEIIKMIMYKLRPF